MKILLLHADLNQRGGAEYYSLKVIDALIEAGHEVLILHVGGPLSPKITEVWKDIKSAQFCKVLKVPSALSKLVAARGMNLLSFSLAVFLARFHVKNFDLLISTYGECYVKGIRQINIVHVPLFLSDKQALEHLGFNGGTIRRIARNGYVRICRFLSGWDFRRIASVFTVANSTWTGSVFSENYKCRHPSTLYIGASSSYSAADLSIESWLSRRNRLTVLGRIVPSKKIELAIEVVLRLRALGFDVGLDIIGSGSGGYLEHIKNLTSHYSWVGLHIGVARSDLESVASSNKWGLHCAKYEHYGIAAVELQRLGCITFVPNTSGQAEVASTPDLLYGDIDEVTFKFEQLLRADINRVALLNDLRKNLVREHDANNFNERLWSIFDRSSLKAKAC